MLQNSCSGLWWNFLALPGPSDPQEGKAVADSQLHSLVSVFTQPLLRQQLVCLAHGESRGRLPLLCQAVAPLVFIPIAERVVEGLHASLKRASRAVPRTSLSRLVFLYHAKDIMDWVSEHPQHLTLLGDLAYSCRSPDLALKQMGFWHHPAIARAWAQCRCDRRLFNRTATRVTSDVLYHADVDTLFAPVPCRFESQDQLAPSKNDQDDVEDLPSLQRRVAYDVFLTACATEPEDGQQDKEVVSGRPIYVIPFSASEGTEQQRAAVAQQLTSADFLQMPQTCASAVLRSELGPADMGALLVGSEQTLPTDPGQNQKVDGFGGGDLHSRAAKVGKIF